MPEPTAFTVSAVTWLSVDAAIAVIMLRENLPPVSPFYVETSAWYTALVGPDGCYFLEWRPDKIVNDDVRAAMIREYSAARAALQ